MAFKDSRRFGIWDEEEALVGRGGSLLADPSSEGGDVVGDAVVEALVLSPGWPRHGASSTASSIFANRCFLARLRVGEGMLWMSNGQAWPIGGLLLAL